jgi:hypothetical protein
MPVTDAQKSGHLQSPEECKIIVPLGREFIATNIFMPAISRSMNGPAATAR